MGHTRCDPNQLESAILNLCINARQAMPNGGRLTIETANTWLDERIARERDIPSGQYVAVSVTDTGTGMPPAVIARAFDPFFTTKPRVKAPGWAFPWSPGLPANPAARCGSTRKREEAPRCGFTCPDIKAKSLKRRNRTSRRKRCRRRRERQGNRVKEYVTNR